jgi:hypothetical protein
MGVAGSRIVALVLLLALVGMSSSMLAWRSVEPSAPSAGCYNHHPKHYPAPAPTPVNRACCAAGHNFALIPSSFSPRPALVFCRRVDTSNIALPGSTLRFDRNASTFLSASPPVLDSLRI